MRLADFQTDESNDVDQFVDLDRKADETETILLVLLAKEGCYLCITGHRALRSSRALSSRERGERICGVIMLV